MNVWYYWLILGFNIGFFITDPNVVNGCVAAVMIWLLLMNYAVRKLL